MFSKDFTEDTLLHWTTGSNYVKKIYAYKQRIPKNKNNQQLYRAVKWLLAVELFKTKRRLWPGKSLWEKVDCSQAFLLCF